MNADVVTIILAVIAATGASFATAIATRPKTRAEANAADLGAAVNVSADAREWVKKFEERADKSDAKAQAAQERADHAEDRADECERRMNAVERDFADLARYTLIVLEHWGIDGPPPPMPASLMKLVNPPETPPALRP